MYNDYSTLMYMMMLKLHIQHKHVHVQYCSVTSSLIGECKRKLIAKRYCICIKKLYSTVYASKIIKIGPLPSYFIY